jgi:hypothetical protein
MYCKYCGWQNNEKNKFCKHCGKVFKTSKEETFPEKEKAVKSVSEDKVFCKYCGGQIIRGSKFCKLCGKGLKEVVKPEVVEKKELITRKKLVLVLATVIPVVVIGIILGILGGLGVFSRQRPEYVEQGVFSEDGVAKEEEAADLETGPGMEISLPADFECEEEMVTEELSEQEAFSKAEDLSNASFNNGNIVRSPDYDFSIEYPDGWDINKVEDESGLYIDFTSPDARALGLEICTAVFKAEPMKSCPPENLACTFAINNADYENWTYVRSEEHSSDFKVYEFYYVDGSGIEYLSSFIFADRCENLVMYAISTKVDHAFAAYTIAEMMLETMSCEETYESEPEPIEPEPIEPEPVEPEPEPEPVEPEPEPEPEIECPEVIDIRFYDWEWEEFDTLRTNSEYYAEVTVQGADSSDLYYDWTEVPGGYIEDNYGSYIRFYAPSYPGYYDITVYIYGPDDCWDSYTETIEVVEPVPEGNRPPEVTNVYGVFVGRTDDPYYIYWSSVDAVDPDGDPLTYDWSISEGEIVYEEGDYAQWCTGDYGYFEVYVTISDGKEGGTITYTIDIEIRYE